MSVYKSICSIGAAVAMCFTAAFADDHEPSMSMVSLFEIDPAKTDQFDEAWKVIQKTAQESDYAYTDFVGGSRNERWIATPLKNFADVDAVMAARKSVMDAGGRKVEKALEAFYGAMTDSHTFFTRDDDELSYQPEGAEGGPFMEIETFYYRYGADDEMRDILSDYKALVASKNVPYGYQVSWDTIGAQGNSVTMISYAENAVALAEQNAAINAMLEGDSAFEDLFARFLAINTGSDTMHTRYNPGASINPEGANTD